jgi:O-antigen/teichoic acid export membrane protein
MCRDSPWARRPRIRWWPAILSRVKWLLLGALAFAMFSQGDYLVLGVLLDAETVGVYFFAFQLALQINQLLGPNLRIVLFPAMSRLIDEPDRLRAGLLRAVRVLSFLGAAAGVMLSVAAEPLIALVWQGRWAAAAVPTQIMAGFFAFRLLFGVLQSVTMARGRFASLAWLTMGLAAGLIVAVSLSAVFVGDAVAAAIAVGVFFLLGVSGALWLTVRDLGVSAAELAVCVALPWGACMLAGGGAIAVQSTLLVDAHGLIRLIVPSAMYAATMFVVVRGTMPRLLNELVGVLPGRFRSPARRVLLLREPGGAAS